MRYLYCFCLSYFTRRSFDSTARKNIALIFDEDVLHSTNKPEKELRLRAHETVKAMVFRELRGGQLKAVQK